MLLWKKREELHFLKKELYNRIFV